MTNVSPIDRARTLLENIRRILMMRGSRLPEHRRGLKAHIESAIADQDVPERLAARMAFQLVLKVSPPQLGDERVWSALGSLLHEDVVRFQRKLHLTDRLIRVALPKLSVEDIERVLDDMQRIDARYGRRLLAEAALDGADPRAMARRYARAFTESVSRLAATNPRIACTLAGAAVGSRHPVDHAIEHLSRFDALVHQFQGNVAFARTVAKAAFIAPDPVRAARQFVRDDHAVVHDLTVKGLELSIARTLASTAALGADPLKTAPTLVESFQRIENMVKRTSQEVSRSRPVVRATRWPPRDCTSRTTIAS